MATTNELSIKLLIDTKEEKVYFAEAGSDVVEFLSSLLSLPLGTVTDLLTKDRMVGSVGNVLGSMQKLDANYKSKGPQLSPAVGPATLSLLQQLLGSQQLSNGSGNGKRSNDNGSSNHLVLYTCKGKKQTCADFLSAASGSACPGCSCPMNKATRQVLVNAEGATYTVGDDLSVTPSANVVSGVVTLLMRHGVKDLKEKVVKIGKEEALGILAASLKSKTVLTDVFLRNMYAGSKRKSWEWEEKEEEEKEEEEKKKKKKKKKMARMMAYLAHPAHAIHIMIIAPDHFLFNGKWRGGFSDKPANIASDFLFVHNPHKFCFWDVFFLWMIAWLMFVACTVRVCGHGDEKSLTWCWGLGMGNNLRAGAIITLSVLKLKK